MQIKQFLKEKWRENQREMGEPNETVQYIMAFVWVAVISFLLEYFIG